MNKEQSIIALPDKQLNRLQNVYSDISYQNAVAISADTNLIINDIGINSQEQQQLQELTVKNLVFLDPDELSSPLRERFNQLDSGTLLVFPKNGALQVKDRLDVTNCSSAVIKVSRKQNDLLYGRNIEEPEEMLDMLATVKPEKIEIVDDVIAKGATVSEIRKYFEEISNQTYLWSASCWLMCLPSKKNQNSSGLPDIQQVTTNVVYSGADGRQTPLNSISTWTFDQMKGQTILNQYAQRYATDPTGFIQFINELSNTYR